jgi:hypothetical protein
MQLRLLQQLKSAQAPQKDCRRCWTCLLTESHPLNLLSCCRRWVLLLLLSLLLLLLLLLQVLCLVCCVLLADWLVCVSVTPGGVYSS